MANLKLESCFKPATDLSETEQETIYRGKTVLGVKEDNQVFREYWTPFLN